DGTDDEDMIRDFKVNDILDFSGYLDAGGTLEFAERNSGVRVDITLSNDVFGQDYVTVRGDEAGINAAVEQLSALV
ncbi:MAG: KH domain-containing protein, partial [Crocosphaera sp.]